MFSKDMITFINDSKVSNANLPFSPDLFIAMPNRIANTIMASKLSRDSSFEKSFTVRADKNLDKRVMSSSVSVVASSVVSSAVCIYSLYSIFTSLIGYVTSIPTSTATSDMIMKTSTVVPSILPSLFG